MFLIKQIYREIYTVQPNTQYTHELIYKASKEIRSNPYYLKILVHIFQ